MGLDMYLYGEKSDWSLERQKEDDFPLASKTLEIAYWRKHPNLHGYIVEEFAEGKDECQRIELGPDEIRVIIQAIKDNKLPHTSGFFFGESPKMNSPNYDAQKKGDIEVFEKALAWIETQTKNEFRSIYYQASW